MNKKDTNRIMVLYRSGGISEALVTEIIIAKVLNKVPGLELEHFVVENAIRLAAELIDTFYKTEVWCPETSIINPEGD